MYFPPKLLTVAQLTTKQRDTSVGTTRKSYFTPYESPLKKFRAYRFHPAFEKEVAGGFKSLTYSNNIKEDQELCRYELAGGVCNDKSCEFQHFKTMGLAGASMEFLSTNLCITLGPSALLLT
jgi:hypothetical protein